jgi:DNA-binding CsgD family transcriptional regulator
MSASTLSKREIEVLQLVAADEANKEIGAQLSLSKDSMGKRVTNVMAKLRAKDCTHAVTIGLKRGINELYAALTRSGPGRVNPGPGYK